MSKSKYPDTIDMWGITWMKQGQVWIGPAITDPEDPLLALAVQYECIIRRDGRYVLENPSNDRYFRALVAKVLKSPPVSGVHELYDTDFYSWTQQQAEALRAKDWPALDVDHLAEEIADLGQSIENAIEHQLERLLLHLLKYRYDPAQRPRRGWRVTIRNARHELAKLIRKNPGLQHHPACYLAEAYHYARDNAPDTTGLPLTTFPEACPWTLAQVLAADFWPEG
jgi:hypothetical protein